MKYFLVISLCLHLCSAAPAPVPAPAPKADPSVVYATPLVTAPAISYSNIYRPPPPLYSTYTPYVYNLGYASSYAYGSVPYYIL